jgi:hypothetical protein
VQQLQSIKTKIGKMITISRFVLFLAVLAVAFAQEGQYDTGESLPGLSEFWDEVARPQEYQQFKHKALSYWRVLSLI